MKNEGFKPSKYGLYPLNMKIMGSHGSSCLFKVIFWGIGASNLDF